MTTTCPRCGGKHGDPYDYLTPPPHRDARDCLAELRRQERLAEVRVDAAESETDRRTFTVRLRLAVAEREQFEEDHAPELLGKVGRV